MDEWISGFLDSWIVDILSAYFAYSAVQLLESFAVALVDSWIRG